MWDIYHSRAVRSIGEAVELRQIQNVASIRAAAVRLGLMVIVTAANVPERERAKLVFAKIKDWFPRLSLIWVDKGFTEQLLGFEI